MLLKDILIEKKDSNKVAIKQSKKEITYKQLFNCAESIAKLIKDSQIKTANIGIFLPNSIEYAIVYFAITFLDRVIVPIAIQAKEVEIKSIIDFCELNLIITNSKYKDILKKFIDDLEYEINIFNIDDKSFDKAGVGSKNFDICMSDKQITENSVAIMLRTSGTTSNPKLVMLTHKNLISNVKSNIESLKFTEEDKTLVALPMFFGYCNTAQFLTHLFVGASIVIMDVMFMPNIFFKLVREERITNFTAVPSMLLMLLSYNKHKYDISSLRYICFGGSNMPIEKLKQLVKVFPSVGFVQTYGQTEASPRVTALLPDDMLRKIGSVGKPIPNVKVRIVNENGEDTGVGETGEIIVHGDNVMKGYYKRPEETAKVIKEGWLYTGDLARYDDEGYIYLLGRKKNMIIRGGVNIYPEEIEEILMCHPSVKEVCVYGESHELLGEALVAMVVLKNDTEEVNEGLLTNYCMDKLANYKVPDRIEFVKELPKTVTGKIRRY